MNFPSANLKKNSAASVMYSERADCLIPEIIQKVNWHWQPSQQINCVYLSSVLKLHIRDMIMALVGSGGFLELVVQNQQRWLKYNLY